MASPPVQMNAGLLATAAQLVVGFSFLRGGVRSGSSCARPMLEECPGNRRSQLPWSRSAASPGPHQPSAHAGEVNPPWFQNFVFTRVQGRFPHSAEAITEVSRLDQFFLTPP